MHDVLVLSLSIFFIKSQGVYDAKSLNGVYFFTAAVLFMILAYAWLRQGRAAEETRRRPAEAAAAGLDAAQLRLQLPHHPGDRVLRARRDAAGHPLHHRVRVDQPALGRHHHLGALQNEEFFLCFVIFMFSIVFPFMKLFYLLTLVTSPDMPAEFRDKSISAMEWLGRYSMTDVMVLALMIFYINASGYTEASVLPGIYFFAASALMTMFAYGWANSVTPGIAAPKPVSLQARLAELAPAPPMPVVPPPRQQRRELQTLFSASAPPGGRHVFVVERLPCRLLHSAHARRSSGAACSAVIAILALQVGVPTWVGAAGANDQTTRHLRCRRRASAGRSPARRPSTSSGIACMDPPGSASPRCLLVNDESTFAQLVTIKGSKFVAGEQIPLIGADPDPRRSARSPGRTVPSQSPISGSSTVKPSPIPSASSTSWARTGAPGGRESSNRRAFCWRALASTRQAGCPRPSRRPTG